MTEGGDIESVGRLADAEPEQVSAWLESVRGGRREAPENFNWHGLAQTAASLAQEADAPEAQLGWARVAVAVYDWLAGQPGVAPDSFTASAMNLRADMISRLGDEPGHPVLDMSLVTGWFWDRLPMPFEEAERAAAAWREKLDSGKVSEMTEPEVEKVRSLRQIKNRLGVIRQLVAARRLPPDPELGAWLALRERLP